MPSTQPAIVAVFDDRNEAAQAVRELEAAGFASQQIGFVIRGEDVARRGMITDEPGVHDLESAVTGAATGAVVGGVIGAAAALLVPGVGPILAGGVLASLVGGAAAGTAVGGILGALTGLGVSEDEARYYEQMFHAGKAIVVVKPGQNTGLAAGILASHGGYNMHKQTESPIPFEGNSSGDSPR